MPAPQAAKNTMTSVAVPISAPLQPARARPEPAHWRFASNRHEQAVQDGERRRRIPGHFHVHRQHVRHAVRAGETVREHPARQRARAYGDDPLRRRHGFIDLLQREAHLIGHGTDDQQHVRVARGRRDEKAEPVHVVIRIVELLYFIQACAAVARVHDEDVDGAPERPAQFISRAAARAARPIRRSRPSSAGCPTPRTQR